MIKKAALKLQNRLLRAKNGIADKRKFVPYAAAVRVALLSRQGEHPAKVAELTQQLEKDGKQVDVYMIVNEKKELLTLQHAIHKSQIGHRGAPKAEKMNTLLATDYDYLIVMCEIDAFAENILLRSRAKSIIGLILSDKSHLFTLSVASGKAPAPIAVVMPYLKKINQHG